MFHYHNMIYEWIPTMLVLLALQNYTLRKRVVSFRSITHIIPHTVFATHTLAWWYHKCILLYKIITTGQISHEEEKVGIVSENYTVHITGCTLLSTITPKHDNTAANKQCHTYLIHFDYMLVISNMWTLYLS